MWNLTCTMCGQPVEHIPALEPGFAGGGTSSWMWLCDRHRAAMRAYLGEPEPDEPDPADNDDDELIAQAQQALARYLAWQELP